MTAQTVPPPAAGLSRHGSLAAGKIRNFLWPHKWLILAALALVGIGGWQAMVLFLGPVVPVDRAKHGELIETVVATGNVATLFRAQIGSQIVGTVEKVEVDEGQRVTEGQTLILLESSELKADVVQAQGAVDQAEAHMRQLTEMTLPTARQSFKNAQATLINDQKTYDRTVALTRDGNATRAALDLARNNRDVATTLVRSAQFAVETNMPGGSDFVTGQTLVSQARASLDTAESRLGYATISAPRAGVLIARNVEQGSVVQPGSTLLTLAPDGDTLLVLEIDERNLGKLALAQKAIASADAYPDKRFPAVVSYINPGIDITRASVEVRLTAPNPPAYLRQDMTVSVDIEVARSKNGLVLPSRSVHDALSAKPWVMLIKNGHAARQPVHLGVQGNTQIEILDGVADGDAVVPATSAVLAGQRVRPASA